MSSVDISGGLYKVMYVKLKPVSVMAGRDSLWYYGMLNNENIESPGGEVRNDAIVMSVRTACSYTQVEDFEYLVVKRAWQHTYLYLKDVADVYIGAETKTDL